MIRFRALKPIREAKNEALARKRPMELIFRGPQSGRFHLQSEIALDTVELQNNGSRVAF